MRSRVRSKKGNFFTRSLFNGKTQFVYGLKTTRSISDNLRMIPSKWKEATGYKPTGLVSKYTLGSAFVLGNGKKEPVHLLKTRDNPHALYEVSFNAFRVLPNFRGKFGFKAPQVPTIIKYIHNPDGSLTKKYDLTHEARENPKLRYEILSVLRSHGDAIKKLQSQLNDPKNKQKKTPDDEHLKKWVEVHTNRTELWISQIRRQLNLDSG